MIVQDITTLYFWLINLNFEEQLRLFNIFLIPVIVYFYRKVVKLEKEFQELFGS